MTAPDDVMSFEIPTRLAARLVLFMDALNAERRDPLPVSDVLILCIAFALEEYGSAPHMIAEDLAADYLGRG